MVTKRHILREFDDNLECYSRFSEKLRELLGEIVATTGIQVHSITARTKARASLEKTLSGRATTYSSIGNITDICGVRLITYFEDDVDKVATAIESEFEIDEENSVDKRALLDPDRFGYLSLHYVVSLNPQRADLLEYRRFKAIKAEIQVRSILQHAWAEIEHDLGYKSAMGVPRDIRREFSRLAGLLEIADREFTGIRDRLVEYENEVVEAIRNNPTTVLIDKASLNAFITVDQTVSELDRRLGKEMGVTVNETAESSVEWYAQKLQVVGVNNIGQLRSLLIERADEIVAFAKEWIKTIPRRHGPLTSLGGAVCLMYLTLFLAGLSEESVASAITQSIKGNDEEREKALRDIRRLAAATSAPNLQPG